MLRSASVADRLACSSTVFSRKAQLTSPVSEHSIKEGTKLACFELGNLLQNMSMCVRYVGSPGDKGDQVFETANEQAIKATTSQDNDEQIDKLY